jgi:hypothetical protein
MTLSRPVPLSGMLGRLVPRILFLSNYRTLRRRWEQHKFALDHIIAVQEIGHDCAKKMVSTWSGPMVTGVRATPSS